MDADNYKNQEMFVSDYNQYDYSNNILPDFYTINMGQFFISSDKFNNHYMILISKLTKTINHFYWYMGEYDF